MPVDFETIVVGNTYSRRTLANLWGYESDAAIKRGVVTPRNDNKIILFITRGQSQYQNCLFGRVLLMEGPADHFAESRIRCHQETGDEIHLFFRTGKREDFTYMGRLALFCCQQMQTEPSRFAFCLNGE